MPEYSFRVYVDGLPVLKYKSDVRVAQFLVPSLNNLSEHLEYQTKVAQIWQIHQERKMKFLIGFLNKTSVKPKVKISSSESGSGTKLHCWVYGFYPRDVEVKWIKNGRDEIYSEESAEILPNPDGTYQIRVSVEVTPEEGATYSCHVDHSSLENPLVTFERKISHMTYRIAAAVAVAILFALALFLCKKMKGFECNRQSVRTEEQDYNQ
ncbi:major histocompatibility complex class I-related gene protein-like [Xenopus laevis]|uniref:Major histocompatibility complex class I-related gene protein-like n=1 Tax=Xenopus laevis TaxID=8355 RepID=A0A8J1LK69_XENLA|nr:major histocompatibility complex class I-related gene protein-like [Xenopus laevis]